MFSASQVLSGIDLDTYNLNATLNEQVIVIAIVACMPNTGIVSRDITLFTVTNRRRRGRMLRTADANDGYAHEAVTNAQTDASSHIDISYIVQFYNPSLTFAQVADLLSENIKDGVFDQALSSAALQYGADDLIAVTSSSINIVNLLSASNEKVLSASGIVGIVMAGVFVLSLFGACCYWFVFMKKNVSDISETFSKVFSPNSTESKGENETDRSKHKESELNENPRNIRKSLSLVRRNSASYVDSGVSERENVITTENVFRDRLKDIRRKEMNGHGSRIPEDETAGKKVEKKDKADQDYIVKS
jgi:hypothetical protein